jgi:hypothetical protein
MKYMVVYGLNVPEPNQAAEETEDNGLFVGSKEECDKFYAELIIDGTYPSIYLGRLLEQASAEYNIIRYEDEEEEVDHSSEGCC